MALIEGPIPYELSNGGLGIAMRFDNDEYIHIERHHDKDGRPHDITPILTSRLSTAIEGIRAYRQLRIAPFEEGFVQFFGAEPSMSGGAELAEEIVVRHFGKTAFFRLDGNDGTVFWGTPSLRAKNTAIEYAESAIMQPEFDSEVFSEFIERTATPDIQKNAVIVNEAVIGKLVETTA